MKNKNNIKVEKKKVLIKNKNLNYESKKMYLKIGLINIGTLTDKNNIHEFNKKEQIKFLFDEDKKLDILICTENNIEE